MVTIFAKRLREDLIEIMKEPHFVRDRTRSLDTIRLSLDSLRESEDTLPLRLVKEFAAFTT